MLRVLLVASFCYICSYGLGEHITTLQASFTQYTKSQGNTLVYGGKLYVKSPARAKWIYENPTQKEIYINEGKAVVYEPLLEQASMGHAKIDFLKILRQATRQPDGTYTTEFENIRYTLLLEKDLPKKLAFVDEFDNVVEIIFSKVQINTPINESEFVFTAPAGVDIIESF